MSFSESLYAQAEPEWKNLLEHPFIQGMKDGTLDERLFRNYMIQDYLYLTEYVKIIAVTLTRAKTLDEIKFLSEMLSQTVNELDQVHLVNMKRLGISAEEVRHASDQKERTDYLSFMMEQAASFDVLTGLVVLLQCSWSYAYIAEQIVRQDPDVVNRSVYGSWFASYDAMEYKTANQHLTDMVDCCAIGIEEEEKKRLTTLFVRCNAFEHAFWDMLYRG